MDHRDYLTRQGLDPSALAPAIDAAIGLGAGDALLVVGSLAEGLGNARSDLDLLLITDRASAGAAGRELAVVVGDSLFDVQILPLAAFDRLLGRFGLWTAALWDVSRPPPFSGEEQRLLHRVSHGIVLSQNDTLAARTPALRDLARLKLQLAWQTARTIQVDLVGYADVGDFRSMVFASQDLLGFAADALAAAHLLTNPTPKWRLSLLERLPPDWAAALAPERPALSAADTYWSLHRAPPCATEQAAVDHAHAIVAFHRRACLEAQVRLLAVTLGDDPDMDDAPPAPDLPSLRLDVDVTAHHGGARLARLNAPGAPIELTHRELRLALRLGGGGRNGSAAARDLEVRSAAWRLAARLEQAGLCERGAGAGGGRLTAPTADRRP